MAPKPSSTGGLPDFDRIMAFLVPFRRKGRNRVCREFARHILYGNLIFVQGQIGSAWRRRSTPNLTYPAISLGHRT